MVRQEKIKRSVLLAITHNEQQPRKPLFARLFTLLVAFFTLFQIKLARIRNDLFSKLRTESFLIDEDGYERSFDTESLESKGDMGYSGSSFFNTSDGKYLVKSVPRGFENSFFRDDLLEPYVRHMATNPKSFLIRITDFLGWQQVSLGGLLGLIPTHHIIMENLLVGRDEAKEAGGGKWETWDLKPNSYFFPERDVAGGKLSSEATKSKLADNFDDKLSLTQEDADLFLAQLEKDVTLLRESRAVDYSLFLVRIPLSLPQNPFADDAEVGNEPPVPEYPPFVPPEAPSWRTGIKSADGKWVYRAAVLDFFWAKHKIHAKAMTGLIKTYNLFDRQGPMSITTTAGEYRERFLEMCRGFIEIRGESSSS